MVIFVLLKELADEFYNTFNGQPYNLIEDEVKKEHHMCRCLGTSDPRNRE